MPKEDRVQQIFVAKSFGKKRNKKEKKMQKRGKATEERAIKTKVARQRDESISL